MSESQIVESSEILENDIEEDEYETTSECHEMAAMHFQKAANHHLQAAKANEEGDINSVLRHAHLAYQAQLIAVQYAEVAAMENDVLDSVQLDLEE